MRMPPPCGPAERTDGVIEEKQVQKQGPLSVSAALAIHGVEFAPESATWVLSFSGIQLMFFHCLRALVESLEAGDLLHVFGGLLQFSSW